MSNKLPDSFISQETTALLESAATNTSPPDDYKCLVCIFMLGASDSHNMVVPYGTDNPNRSLYEIARPFGVRLENSELTNSILSGTTPPWALNPNLIGSLQEWNNGNLAIVRDVGVLTKPTTKTQYSSDLSFRPDALFAHNSQQSAWQTAVAPRALRTTGWFGRTTNLVDDAFNPNMTISSGCLSVSGANPQTFAYSPKINAVYPATRLSSGSARGSASIDFTAIRELFYHKNKTLSPFQTDTPLQNNIVINAFRDIFNNSAVGQDALANAVSGWVVTGNPTSIPDRLEKVFVDALAQVNSTTIQTPNPTDANSPNTRSLPQAYFVNTMRNIARIIYARGADKLNQRRQLIFSGVGGWDNHNGLRSLHDPQLRTLDICIKALIDALKIMGVYDQVTIFTESEFGRTLRSNGTFGTDHAWSGHSFVFGGSVKGGMYGPEPNYTLGGPKDAVGNLGRFIPNYSIEQYYGTMLKWLDLPESLIPLALPNLPAFTPRDIGFMEII